MYKIIHLHGFSSSGQCDTLAFIRKHMPWVNVLSPDLPPSATQAMAFLDNYCKLEQPDLIIGTSMGGFFAQLLRGYKKILINPSFAVSLAYRRNIGTYEWCDPRSDGSRSFEITEAIVQEYEALEKNQFNSISLRDIEQTVGLFAENDELIDNHPLFLKHYKRAFFMPGTHIPSEHSIEKYLVPHAKDILR